VPDEGGDPRLAGLETSWRLRRRAMLLGSVVMAYIAGATYDDRSRRQTWAQWDATRTGAALRRRDDHDAAAG